LPADRDGADLITELGKTAGREEEQERRVAEKVAAVPDDSDDIV